MQRCHVFILCINSIAFGSQSELMLLKEHLGSNALFHFQNTRIKGNILVSIAWLCNMMFIWLPCFQIKLHRICLYSDASLTTLL